MSDSKNKIYVGNLPNDVRKDDIDKLFEKVFTLEKYFVYSMELSKI